MTQSRRFHLQRTVDVTGASGTGRVADGIQWPDGTVSIRWAGERPSIVFWTSINDAEWVHGHGGATQIVWDDGETGANTPAARLARIAQAHVKHIDANGGTTGDCVECGETWPCPTSIWATSDRDPLATWDPADDEPEYADCPAGLMSADPDVPIERCIVEGVHQQHVSAMGTRWHDDPNGDTE